MATSTTIHPTEVRGNFHNARIFVRTLLILFILGLPWLKINGHQAFLLDILHRKFSIFGFLFFAQDVPLLFLLVINFVLGIALTTALFGRVWCGWMCPQTVFIEGIFRRIEKWTEGKAETRRKRDAQPYDFDRFLRSTVKWFLFAMCTLIVTHSILAIFVGSDRLLEMIGRPFSENPTPVLFILLSNFILLADFGVLREQFCIVACPYGKFQSVLQDSYTVSIAYDSSRSADCVDCFRCVRVCPTGIDIRNGSQLECVACTACADACNDVMTRLKRPTALIGYHSEAQVQRKPHKWFRPRIAIYLTLITLFGGVALYQIFHYTPFEVMLYKTKGAPYSIVQVAPGIQKVTNLFSVELSNRSDDPVQISVQGGQAADILLVMPNNPITLEGGKVLSNPMTIEFDQTILHLGSAERELMVSVKNLVTGQSWKHTEKVRLIGPF